MLKRNLLSKILVAVFVVAGSTAAFAQGRYANVYSRTDVDNFVRSLESTSDTFSRDFRSTRGTTTNERRIVARFENAVDRLRQNFSSSNSWWNSRNDVQGMMGEARQVNVMMNNDRFARSLERQWRELRRDINKLADTYELPEIAGGRGGGNGFPGGGFPGVGGNVPSWAIGTFYGRNPNTGGSITMNVSRNGNVTIDFGQGAQTYATLNRQTLNVDGVTSRVTRLNNGIRTSRGDNGEIIDYYRDAAGIGGGVYPGEGGYPGAGGGNVPNWALGTFYARNPQNGGRITLVIDEGGSVSVQFGNGAPNYATLNGTTLNNQGIQARVSRINNGIRTTRMDNGEVIDYYRSLR